MNNAAIPAPWHPPAPAGGKHFLATVKKEAPRVSSSALHSRYRNT